MHNAFMATKMCLCFLVHAKKMDLQVDVRQQYVKQYVQSKQNASFHYSN